MKRLSLKFLIFLLVLAGIGAAFFVVPQKRPFPIYLERAEEAYQKHDFNHAIGLYLKALEYYPKHERTPEVLLSIGDIYNFSLGNNEKAGKAYQMLIKQYPKTMFSRKAYNHSAEMYEKVGQYADALLAYQGIIDDFPYAGDIDENRFKVAMMALRLKKYEPARRSLMQIIEKKPDTPIADQVLYQLGTIFFMEGSIRESIQVLEVAVEKYPESPLANDMKFTLANALEEMGALDRAIKIYKEIRSSYPNRKVVEKKIEKLTARDTERIQMKKQMVEKAKKENRSPESQKSKTGDKVKPADASKATAKTKQPTTPTKVLPEDSQLLRDLDLSGPE